MYMTEAKIKELIKKTDFIHTSGTPEELKIATLLKEESEKIGAKAWLESFEVDMATMKEAHLYADGKEIPCKGYFLCGNADVEAPFLYLPNTDDASLEDVKGKIVLIDSGMTYFLFKDLYERGVAGFITYNGDVNYRDNDIDQKELRGYVAEGKKLPGVNVNAKEAFKLVKNGTKTVRIVVEQDEYKGESHNTVAEIPGTCDQWIVLSAHLDTTSLSRGSYDNMTGCLGLLCIMDEMMKAKHHYGLRFLFCGSEERGLLGSKAYVKQHEEELEKVVLNINLDMIGTVMGKFIACVSAEDALVSYIKYMAAETGWGMAARSGVYSSDSTPFADKGVPALSFARLAGAGQSNIHSRYDTPALLSEHQVKKDSLWIASFTGRMADAVKCPVKRVIPDNVKNDLDIYLNRKRREN